MPSAFLLVLGTTNRKKAAELAELLAPQRFAAPGMQIEIKTLADFPGAPQVAEDGETFADNARKKAAELARALGRWVLGEDSGLAVEALGGRPGVYSARYSGPGATDESNNRKLLEELAGVPPDNRGAKYVCAVALADPQGAVRAQAQGVCHGTIGDALRGTHGFGYDPLFVIPEYHRTFAELGPRVKRLLSHRARALAELRPQLLPLLRAQ